MWKETSKGILLNVKVIPNASQNEIIGWENLELKVRISVVPDKGKANEALVAFLAASFKLKRSQITLLKGQTSRHKVLLIDASINDLMKHSL